MYGNSRITNNKPRQKKDMSHLYKVASNTHKTLILVWLTLSSILGLMLYVGINYDIIIPIDDSSDVMCEPLTVSYTMIPPLGLSIQ